jgi:hypothetical protein
MRSHGENGLQSNYWKISYPQRVFKTVNATIPLYPIRSRCSTSRSTTGTSLTFPWSRRVNVGAPMKSRISVLNTDSFHEVLSWKLCLQYHKNWEPKMTSLEPHQLHDAPGLRTSCWGRLKQMRPCLGEHRMQRGKHMRCHRRAIDIFDELNVSVLAYKQSVHLYMMLTNWIRL